MRGRGGGGRRGRGVSSGFQVYMNHTCSYRCIHSYLRMRYGGYESPGWSRVFIESKWLLKLVVREEGREVCISFLLSRFLSRGIAGECGGIVLIESGVVPRLVIKQAHEKRGGQEEGPEEEGRRVDNFLHRVVP